MPEKKAEKALKESEAVLKKAMADLKWPGHNPNFEGPGNPRYPGVRSPQAFAEDESGRKTMEQAGVR